MRATKIRIKNLFGINELELDGRSVEFCGENGVGKTSVIDAIKYALTNKSDRDYIIKNGEIEGEIFIEADNGISITRKPRTQQADYKRVIDSNGRAVGNAETFLKEIFTDLQLSPVQFLQMDKKEQNRVILDMIEFDWNLSWIKEQFGEIPPNINWDQNILQVLHDIQADNGYYYMTRQDVNRDIRNKNAIVDDVSRDIPEGYNAEKWESQNLSEVYRVIETWRQHNAQIEKAEQMKANYNNKIRSFEAEKEIAISAIDKASDNDKSRLEKDIANYRNLITQAENELSQIEEKKLNSVKLAEADYQTKVAKFDGEIAEYEPYLEMEKHVDDLATKLQEAETIQIMKGHLNEYYRMVKLQNEVAELSIESERLTKKIEKARSLPGEILETATLPIEGLEIKDGIPLINGLPISNLSEGEKLDLCIDVTINKPSGLQIILIDGIEKLSSSNRNRIYEKCKSHGLQFIATRTDDSDELTITYLE